MIDPKLGHTGLLACIPFLTILHSCLGGPRSMLALLYINREQTLEFEHPVIVTKHMSQGVGDK
jgi:hypothetical protein